MVPALRVSLWRLPVGRASFIFYCEADPLSFSSEPSAEALRKIATSLHVTTDSLLFEDGERDPDDRLKLQFEALAHLDAKEREAVETVIASVLHMHDAKRWTQPATPAAGPKPAAKKKPSGAARAGSRG